MIIQQALENNIPNITRTSRDYPEECRKLSKKETEQRNRQDEEAKKHLTELNQEISIRLQSFEEYRWHENISNIQEQRGNV